jgi:Uma2 family endonuclease
MATLALPEPIAAPTGPATVAELLENLGVPACRVRLHPPLGQATEHDAAESKYLHGAICELVDGTLVEKPMGFYESSLGMILGGYLHAYLIKHSIGFVVGESGASRTIPGRVRMPDVGFYSWTHFPGRILPAGGVLNMAADLVVEILSPSNTRAEMEQKRQEYFASGTRLYWEVLPETRHVRVFTDANTHILLGENDSLTGEPVLPGFVLSIHEWFSRAGNRPVATPPEA